MPTYQNMDYKACLPHHTWLHRYSFYFNLTLCVLCWRWEEGPPACRSALSCTKCSCQRKYRQVVMNSIFRAGRQDLCNTLRRVKSWVVAGRPPAAGGPVPPHVPKHLGSLKPSPPWSIYGPYSQMHAFSLGHISCRMVTFVSQRDDRYKGHRSA